MMAPTPLLPAGPPADAGPHLPEVRLDVRVGSGRAVGYDLTRGEFLVGGADGCDLKLLGSNLPPVVCQLVRDSEGVSLVRLAPVFPILVNGAPFTGHGRARLQGGDRVTVGSADVLVSVSGRGHVRPTFHPISRAQTAKPATPPVDATSLQRERADLDRARAQLAEQARELEADRVAWYRRRQEIEAEVRAIQETATSGTRLADREAWLTKREAEIATRERELADVRAELNDIRQSLFSQYRERRDQLEQMQQVVRGATDTFDERQRRAEADLVRRRQELDDEATRLQQYVTAEVDRRAAGVESDFRRRKLELEAAHAARLQELDTEAAERRHQFARELSAVEVPPAPDPALDARKAEIQSLQAELVRQQQAIDSERRWLDERTAEHDRIQAAREAEIARQEQLLEEDRSAFEKERVRYADDLLRLDRWQAAVEDRQLHMDRRAAEIDQQVKQLTRDAIELEEHVRLADAEQQRMAAESGRLDVLKVELERRAAEQTERYAHLEAQQASLAVLRSRLDRQQAELDREAAALTHERSRLSAAQRLLDDRLTEAERLRTELGASHATTAAAEAALGERQRLLDVELAEVRRQRDELAAELDRLQQHEQDLDRRSADIAEQTAVLKAKTAQVIDLQQRLEVDRTAVRTREGTLADADTARGVFQDQLRKRAEELAQRSRDVDATAAKLADERLALDRMRAELSGEREWAEQTAAQVRQAMAEQEQELIRRGGLLDQREAALQRQIERLRDTGRTIATGRKELFLAKRQWEDGQDERANRTAAVVRQLDDLRQQTPGMAGQAAEVMEKLAAARETLRSQLAELHAYAAQTRGALDAVRTDARAELDSVRKRAEDLESARSEHRLAVAEFRNQLLDWQDKLGGLKNSFAQSEQRIEQKRAELESAARKSDDTAVELARKLEQLRIEKDELSDRRAQVERHLADMREWYRKKLRDLAGERREPSQPVPHLHTTPEVVEEPDAGDRHLGDLLRSLELIEPDVLDRLQSEAQRQRRTLRQVLLASGAVSLYQLALIEAGNLDALMLGRFRVIDRVRVTPREGVYRVFDPSRGLCVLRVLGDAEMADAAHPDEYRQRFAAARAAAHPHLVRTLEVLELNGRPAVVQEAVGGLPGSEWPPTAAMPGVWVRLLNEAAAGLDAAHRAGLVHGRLTSDAFLLTPDGVKLVGCGDPPWLTSGMPPSFDPTPDADLRAVGQIAFGWSQVHAARKGRGKKGLPESLLNVIRRLEADPANPMGDTAAAADPYRTAADLLADLRRLAVQYPCPAEEWEQLIAVASDSADDRGVRKAG
jgi:hypothetical protein